MTTGPGADPVAWQAAVHPESPAVIDRDRTWSWAALEVRVSTLAATLADRAPVSRRIGLAVDLSADAVVALHAVVRAGVTAILVNPRLTDAEVGTLLRAAGTDVLVRAGDGAGSVHDGAASTAHPPARPGELVVATSGTTARPKLVRLPWGRLIASAEAWNAVLPPATGWLLSLAPHHVAGLGIVVRAAMAGVPVVVATGSQPGDLLEAIETARSRGVVVSHVSVVAAQLAGLLKATGDLDAPPPAGLRATLVGGGPLPGELLERARATGWPVAASYGMSETGSGVVADGRPLPDAEIRVGGDGEILVRGPMVFAGYLDDPDATALALDPDGWLHTGDTGHLDPDGRLVVDGRRDDTIIRGGENVAPAEVEAVLAEHPGIAEVTVVGIPDRTLGQAVAAVVVPGPGADPTDEELRTHARRRLAGFKVPGRFVRVPELPRGELGKVARGEVARIATTAERAHVFTASDGQALAVTESGPPDGPPIVLLHATMASAAHLAPLARLLVGAGARVVRVDRRGSGASVMTHPGPVPVERHVRDVVDVLDALSIERTALFGHSFGGVVAIEVARRAPDRVTALVAWEPPYVPVAPDRIRSLLGGVGDAVAAGYATAGPEGAARGFVESVGGPAAWAAMPERLRSAIGRAGVGALADAAMVGLTGEGLETITVPVRILTGGASDPFYRPIADALAARIGPTATRTEIADLDHMGPGHSPGPIADAIRDHLGLAPDPTLEMPA